MPISAVDTLSLAFQHTKQQLLRPFRMGQWSKLAFVGLLAGELSSGGGCNFGVPHIPQRNSGSEHLLSLPFPSVDPKLLAGLIGLLVVLAIVLWLFFLYINSVMRFILFDSIVAKQCQIGGRWGRRQAPGFSLFPVATVFVRRQPGRAHDPGGHSRRLRIRARLAEESW